MYVRPLKALRADIHKNVQNCGGHRLLAITGDGSARITAAVPTGDTTQTERAAIIRSRP